MGQKGLFTKPSIIEDTKMMAYEFYWNDTKGEAHFIGTLPERRKNPERISLESIMNWGKMVIGDNGEVNKIFFVEVEV
jgi:hypothetical protein